ncbi:MAG: N-acetylmuramoyl-L-alanine amidase [Candidatus Avispirillum sp.]
MKKLCAAALLVMSCLLLFSCSDIWAGSENTSGGSGDSDGIEEPSTAPTADESISPDSPDSPDSSDMSGAPLTVIIDAGHGFGDPGSQPALLGCDEAKVTLSAALLLQKKLTEQGIASILLHDGKNFPSCDKICAEADSLGVSYEADRMRDDGVFSAYERSIYANIIKKRTPEARYFYISLHTNSFEDSGVSGLSADYYNGSRYSEALGDFCDAFKKAAEDSLKKETVVWRDSWEEAFVVTKYADMPSVLIEMGYGTNPRDAADLKSERWMSDFTSLLSSLVYDFSDRF